MLTGVDITQSRPVAEIGSLAPRPVLLIHCAADNYVLASNTEALAAAAPWAQTSVIAGDTCKHTEGFAAVPRKAYIGAKVATFFGESLR